MTVRAYVLLHVEAGKISPVIEAITKLEEVIEAYPITGDYDAIACIEVADVSQIRETVADKIHSIPGVKETSTHIAFK
jgi:DNA-binding Lrp family transcriptional regulator